MSPVSELFTAIAEPEVDRIKVRGEDLCRDLLGHTDFVHYFLFLLTGQHPSPALLRAVNACLVAIAEHGLVPSVVAARMTFAAAPDALQGAVSAGLLGCGQVILGASEAAGHLLADVVRRSEGRDLDQVAYEVLAEVRKARLPLPGFGHPIHRNGDPRAAKLMSLAREWGTAGRHVAALGAIETAVPEVWGRSLVLNVSGAIPAVLLDAGYPQGALRGIPLLARTASLVAHLLEEAARPTGFALADAAARCVTYDGGEP
jgi:citrate synthase